MGKYFTEKERYQLEILLKDNKPMKEIAKLLNKSLATIYNEKKRGLVTLLHHDYTEKIIYQADVAQRRYEENKIDKGRPYKVGNDLQFIKYVECKIKDEKYSPCAVLADIERNNLKFKTNICFKTLYNYIEKGLFLSLSKDSLPMPRKVLKRGKYKRTVALNNVCSRSIDERSELINSRESFGNWEMDTVVSGKGNFPALLVLTERNTRYEIIRKISDKTADSVCTVLNNIELEIGTESFRNIFHTITMDNGSEFKNILGIEKSCLTNNNRTITYFCHPYSSWERGSNENANKLIRRWIPKGSNIGNYTDDFIKYIQDWINNYPRKLFDYKSSNDIIEKFGRPNL